MNYSKGIYSKKEWLETQYVKNDLSLRKISEICKTNHKTIDYWVKKFGFKKHPVGDKSGDKSARWKTGVIKTYGYIAVKIHGHYIPQHRIVAATVLKRGLRKGEVVHHIDFDTKNNKPENLYVFKSQAEHKAYHLALKYRNAEPITSNLI